MLSLSPWEVICYLFCHDHHRLLLVSRYWLEGCKKSFTGVTFFPWKYQQFFSQRWWPGCVICGQAFPASLKKCPLEGWLNQVPACLQNSSCEPSAKWGEEAELHFEKSDAHSCGPSKISAPYMAWTSVWVEAVRDDLILAECSLTPLRVPEWSWGQGLGGCWLLSLPQLWGQHRIAV